VLSGSPAVRDGGAALRSSCAADAEQVVRLEAGSALKVRFAISGEIGTCYKVESDGKSGYLLATEITGLDAYEQERRSASTASTAQMIRSEVTRLKMEILATPSQPTASPLAEAVRLMETNQPREALGVLETSVLKATRKDPTILALAGVAAFQSDQPRRAMEYWSESLALRPNSEIESLYRRAQKELTADKSRNRAYSNRFLLRYDESEIPEATVTEMLAALNDEYRRIDSALGCGNREQIVVVAQNVDAYRASTDAEEWSGGQFDGRIRIVLQHKRFDSESRRAMTHELVHACLAGNGLFPQWFHEGMAQRWSGEKPDDSDVAAVRSLSSPPALGKSTTEARLFYAWAWLAVDRLYRLQGDQYVRNLLRNPDALRGSGN
jgi:hypothetical protein